MLAYTYYESDNRVRRYAEALVKSGNDVDAIVLRREGQVSFEVIAGVRVYRIQTRVIDERRPFSYLAKLLIFLFRSAWEITVRHIRARYDVIHVHSIPDFQVFATVLPRLAGAQVILDIHDIVPELYASKFKVSEQSLVFRVLLLIEKLSIAYSNHVIIANHLWYKKLTQRAVRPDKCTAIINYPDLSIFSERPRTVRADGELVVCYPGTLNWHQGVDVAIAAMGLLRHKAPHVKFLVVGDGPEVATLKAMVKDQHMEDCVTIHGMVSLERVAMIMSNIDIGVVPKRKDSFGNEAFSTKIMEFMAMGVPVIVSDTRIDQYYFSEHLVQFFESDNAEDLAAKILVLVYDSAKRNSLREAGTNFIRHNNWDVRKSEYLALVDRMIGQSKGAMS